ncbi:hypothetical protein ISU10_20135 [Nocardioides agariphilus]|uniref:Uncharacterized protein n=1 Tax=Nocardioides agariphilus TaxID=433664 RepID=A0A930VM82_9ACTN|nr:hypothetical protein [Nocardioides agariphilus]MBF4770089.1 hypothetical protein [Nocardioides agariphilus]
MRSRRFPFVVVVLLALAGCGDQTSEPPATPSATSTKQCRQQWQDLKALHGENGNPEGSARELVARWDEMYQHGLELETSATVEDCGEAIEAYGAQWAGLESLMYGLHPYDMPLQLAIDEGNRKHWVQFQKEMGTPAVLSEELRQAFSRLRILAPESYDDLSEVLAGAGDVRLEDPESVDDFVAEVAAAAEQSKSYLEAVRVDGVIDNAELDEE